ncbi:MAG: hypothetical protein AB1782_06515 [Cyanobacteriota bacterium]
MQATFSPVSFNGGLSDALKLKESQLEMKRKNLQAKAGAEQTANGEAGKIREQLGDLFVSSEDTFERGFNRYDAIVDKAKGEKSNAVKSAKESYQESKLEAKKVLEETRVQTDNLVAELKSVATHAQQLADEAKANLKEIDKTAKPLRKAMGNMAKVSINEASEVAGSVKEAQNAVSGAKDALSVAMKKVADLEEKEEKLNAKHSQEAIEAKISAKAKKKAGYGAAKSTYLGELAELKEEKAQALDEAKEAYRKAVREAKDVLDEYCDLAGADRRKAESLLAELKNMEASVNKIKLQALYTRATNLPNIAAAAIGLGKMGEGATGSIVSRVIRTLTHPDWLASIKGKLGAIGAAELLVKEGSDNQKVAMGTGIELNAGKIVEKTNSLEVIEELKALDQEVEKLNLMA